MSEAEDNYLWILKNQILPNAYGLKRVALLKAIEVLEALPAPPAPESAPPQRFYVFEATPTGKASKEQARREVGHSGKQRTECEMVKATDYDALASKFAALASSSLRPETTAKLEVLVERARAATNELRDATRQGRFIDFRDRDKLVIAIHNALDAVALAASPVSGNETK